MNKLSQTNPDTLVALVGQKSKRTTSQLVTSKGKKTKNTSSQSTINNELGQSSSPLTSRPIRQASLSRYPMAHKTSRPLVYDSGWTNTIEQDYRKTMTARFKEGKMPGSVHH